LQRILFLHNLNELLEVIELGGVCVQHVD
jgi:hypothetical protein